MAILLIALTIFLIVGIFYGIFVDASVLGIALLAGLIIFGLLIAGCLVVAIINFRALT